MADPVALEGAGGDPLDVVGDFFVGEEEVSRVEVAAEVFFFGDELVDGVVAFAAEVEAAGAHVFDCEILPEPGVAVAGLGDEVVEREAGEVLAKAEVARAVGAALGDESGRFCGFLTVRHVSK